MAALVIARGRTEVHLLPAPRAEHVVVAAHAPDRIVWGTNWPHNLAREQSDYPDDRALTDTVLGWLPDEAALQLALVENPEELYGLPAQGEPAGD